MKLKHLLLVACCALPVISHAQEKPPIYFNIEIDMADLGGDVFCDILAKQYEQAKRDFDQDVPLALTKSISLKPWIEHLDQEQYAAMIDNSDKIIDNVYDNGGFGNNTVQDVSEAATEACVALF